MATRAAIYGPEFWAERAEREWSYWDRWFAVVCVVDHGGDWRGLEEQLATRPTFGGQQVEGRLSHLWDLEARLIEAGLTAADVVGVSVDDVKVRARARSKVVQQSLSGPLSPAMRDTPRRRLRARALRGRWPGFPVDPAPFAHTAADILAGPGGSFRRAMALERWMSDVDRQRGDVAVRLAARRGAITAGLEAFIEGIRDSDGAVASLLGDVFVGYGRLDWRTAGVDADVFVADVCELAVWDDYATLYQRETAPYVTFRHGDAERAERHLVALETELRRVRLGFWADEAVQQIVYVMIGARYYDGFVGVATRLGCEHWMPIAAMANAAVSARRVRLARQVVGAAIAGPGHHGEHLRRLCVDITGGPPEPPESPPLRVVR